MKIRSLALALAATFALTTVAEAKKKPVYSHKAPKVHRMNVSRNKVSKRKVSRPSVKRRTKA